jgi:predicted DNA-binding transcriptional regulator AlpA
LKIRFNEAGFVEIQFNTGIRGWRISVSRQARCGQSESELSMFTPTDTFITHSQAALIRGVSTKTLDRWAAAGLIPQPFRMAGRKYHNYKALMAAFQSAPTKTAPAHLAHGRACRAMGGKTAG